MTDTARLVADSATSPFGKPPCPGRQVGESVSPSLDAAFILFEFVGNANGRPLFTSLGRFAHGRGSPSVRALSREEGKARVKGKRDGHGPEGEAVSFGGF